MLNEWWINIGIPYVVRVSGGQNCNSDMFDIYFVFDGPEFFSHPLSFASVWIFSLSEIEGFKEGKLWPENRRKLINTLLLNTNILKLSNRFSPMLSDIYIINLRVWWSAPILRAAAGCLSWSSDTFCMTCEIAVIARIARDMGTQGACLTTSSFLWSIPLFTQGTH